jgi:hypothetical protein
MVAPLGSYKLVSLGIFAVLVLQHFMRNRQKEPAPQAE